MTPDIPEDHLTVPFDPVAGCGVRVALEPTRESSFVSIQFVQAPDEDPPNDLTLAQAEKLRDSLTALIEISAKRG